MKKSTRLPTLEALRGLAGFYIFFHHFGHFYLSMNYPQAPHYFVFGQVAVLGFFIMSGFVIEHSSFAVDPQLSFRTYFVRRFRRIYPIYLVSLVVSYVCACVLAGKLAGVDWHALLGSLVCSKTLIGGGGLIFLSPTLRLGL